MTWPRRLLEYFLFTCIVLVIVPIAAIVCFVGSVVLAMPLYWECLKGIWYWAEETYGEI
jgi:hypothetical protein